MEESKDCNKECSAPHWLLLSILDLHEADPSGWSFAKGRSLQMIIWRRPAPPDDYLREAGPTRWSFPRCRPLCRLSLFVVVCSYLLLFVVCLCLSFVVVCHLPFVVACRLSLVVGHCFFVCFFILFVVFCFLFVAVCRWLLFLLHVVCR